MLQLGHIMVIYKLRGLEPCFSSFSRWLFLTLFMTSVSLSETIQRGCFQQLPLGEDAVRPSS